MKKNKVSLLLVVLFSFISIKINAQDKIYPWAGGVGVNFVDVGSSNFGLSNLNTIPVLSRAYIARYLGKGFVADFTGAINSIDKISTKNVEKKSYYSLDLGLRYNLNHLLGDMGWFDPYAKVAVGTFWVAGDVAGAVSPGLGFNTWFNDSVGLNIETSYKSNSVFGNSNLGNTAYISNYHLQHSISLVFKFGAKDTDGDGVIDANDLCPQIAGKKILLGCTDIDGDGVADKDDLCPELAGTEASKGCPDSDGDGVADDKDKCPNKAGNISNKGCPTETKPIISHKTLEEEV